MRRILIVSLLGVCLTAFASGEKKDPDPARFEAAGARVYRAEPGRALMAATKAAPADSVARFLSGKGLSPATVASLRTAAENRASRGGTTHVRMEQRVGGLRVADAYVKATFNARGELIHVIENVAAVPAAGVAPASVNEAQALLATLAHLYPGVPTPALLTRQGNVSVFDRPLGFHEPPTVERVAIAMDDGSLRAGFEVETWSEKNNVLHYTLVAGDGRVLASELRTNTDQYKVFTENPNVTPQTVVFGPGSGNAESPAGWLAGSQKSVNIGGNNVHAYLDTDANNSPDPGGSPITNQKFLTGADLTTSPSTTQNREVAVTNLFYLNNVMHDTLYSHGFDEAAGNFQINNFGQGGLGNDPVNAEAQDGSGVDNANFATPKDGQSPRMQMYLWTGKGVDQVHIGSTDYPAQGAVFGTPLDATGITAEIVLANDGTGTTSDACEALPSVTGKIVLADRGTCTFVVKVKNAQNAGAVGVIIANNRGDSIFTMGGTDATITIPSVFVGLTSGNAIKATPLPATGTIRLTNPPPLQRDGDVDSDVVFHEYGHGLSWRMIGKMSGPMSGAIGEGNSDAFAVILDEDDVVGEYSFNDPLGLRSAPYTNYPRTYGDIVGSEVHLDGEVYGAIGWRLFQLYTAAGIPKSSLLDDLVDGMNYTPAGPAFEDMRDGILQSVAINNPSHECLVWQAFAQYGVGVGAKGQVRGSTVVVTESFALPSECQ